MEHKEISIENFHFVMNELQSMKAFFMGTSMLESDVTKIAHLLHGIVPVCSIAFVRCDEQEHIIEFAQWHEKGMTCDLQEAIEHTAPALIGLLKADQKRVECWKVSPPLFDRLTKFDFYSVAFPVFHADSIIGFFFYGKRKEYGYWQEEEEKILFELSEIIRISFLNKNNLNYDFFKSFILHSMLDSIDANIYLSDIETNKILFMNKTMKHAFHVENPEGMLCWKILQKDRDKRCEFCPVDTMLNSNMEIPSCHWEKMNTVTGRIYENYDSIIQWIDGSMVHMQHAIDVTDSRLMAKIAVMDELTDMLNCKGGKAALAKTLAEEGQKKHSVIVGLYDINMLKRINDVYGYTEGDRILYLVSKTVKENLDSCDYVFRLSEDEFVVVFNHSNKENASKKMKFILSKLQKLRNELKIPYDLSFCFGLVEINSDRDMKFLDIISQADEEMYEYKKRYHILEVERQLYHIIDNSHVKNSDFTYHSEYLYDALLESTDDYIIICDMKTNTFRFPQPMVYEFGLPGEIIQNAMGIWSEKIHEHDKQIFLESYQSVIEGLVDNQNVEYRIMNRKGAWIWVRSRAHVMYDENGEPSLYAGIITNLGKKVYIDHLTGLLNKFEFENEIKRQFEGHLCTNFGIMILDIDEFKHINNLYNRMFGDEIIRLTAQKIQSLLPRNSKIYRIDGDEFGVIVKNGGRDEMSKIYASIRNSFKYQQNFNGKKYYCTLSAGCSVYPQDGETYLDLMKYAGYSLEYSKKNGRNKITFFSSDILSRQTRSLDLTEILRESIEKGFIGFQLYFQPQVDAANGRVIGAEALTRWRCNKYGMVSPAEFIPLLEKSSMIIPVGKWIFKQAVQKCKQWIQIQPDFVMSINLSYMQVTEPDFIAFMRNTLQEANLCPDNIIVELTESCLVKGSRSVKRIFDKIRGLGIKIAMDDFGTGYSSLEMLKKSPADMVKIDKTFIKDIKTSNFDATFIRFIVTLCHDVGIKVCLEGVEDWEEYHIVNPMGLDFIQGFLFGRPEPEEEFIKKFLK